MAVLELVEVLQDPEWKGLTRIEKLQLLNEWHTEFIPCSVSFLSDKIKLLNLETRLATAQAKGQVDGDLWDRWSSLVKSLALNPPSAVLMFDAKPLFIDQLFQSLRTMTLLEDFEEIWLRDLGRRMWTIARRAYHQDVTEEILTKVEALAPVAAKIASRRQSLIADHQVKMAEAQLVNDQVQARDPAGVPLADPALSIPWGDGL